MFDFMPKGDRYDEDEQDEPNGATDGPEISLAAISIHYALEVHAKVRSEEGEREKDDGDAGEDEDGVVLGVGDDGEFVLLDGFELEKLGLCFSKGGNIHD